MLSGGAANSAVFGQMFADVCGLNIRIPAQPQSGALGGAILGMVSAGIYPDIHTAVDAVVTYTHSFSPNPSVHAYYERKFSRFAMRSKGLDTISENLLIRLYDCRNPFPASSLARSQPPVHCCQFL